MRKRFGGGKRFCQPHLEELHFHLANLPVICSECGLYATEGLLTHDCKNPTAQPTNARYRSSGSGHDLSFVLGAQR